jgi:hypothetical protein
MVSRDIYKILVTTKKNVEGGGEIQMEMWLENDFNQKVFFFFFMTCYYSDAGTGETMGLLPGYQVIL